MDLTIHTNETIGVAQRITDALERCRGELHKAVEIVITATDYNYETSSEYDVHVVSYPEGIIYSLTSDCDFYVFMRDVILKKNFEDQIELEKIAGAEETEKIQCTDIEIASNAEQLSPMNFLRCALPWKTIVLVCVHASRDNRCGRAGPQVIDEFNEQLLKRSICKSTLTVAGSSHIGGHKFAGVLVVYPSGDWYGLISKRNVSDLLDHILADTKYMKGWRGNESLNW